VIIPIMVLLKKCGLAQTDKIKRTNTRSWVENTWRDTGTCCYYKKCQTCFGYNHRRSNLLKRGIAKYV